MSKHSCVIYYTYHLTQTYQLMPLIRCKHTQEYISSDSNNTNQVRRSRLDKLLDQAQKAGCDVALAKMVLATRLIMLTGSILRRPVLVYNQRVCVPCTCFQGHVITLPS